MKKFSPEVVITTFRPEDSEVLDPDRLYLIPHYIDNGYEEQPSTDYTTVYRPASIMIEVDRIGVVDATKKLAPWYGFKKPTEEIASLVSQEIENGILEVVSLDEYGLEIDFRRHSLHKEDVAV